MKAILFDFDGTLVDTQVLYDRAISQILLRFNSKYTQEYCSNFLEGRCWSEAFHALAEENNFDCQKIFDEALHLAKEIISKEAKATDGTFDTLTELKRRNIKMAICSNSHKDEILSVLKYTNLKEFFPEEMICSRDMVYKGKPASEVYILGLKHVGVSPENAIALEDSVNGAKASLDAEIKTIIFAGGSGFGAEEKMEKLQIIFQTENFPCIKNMKSLLEYI